MRQHCGHGCCRGGVAANPNDTSRCGQLLAARPRNSACGSCLWCRLPPRQSDRQRAGRGSGQLALTTLWHRRFLNGTTTLGGPHSLAIVLPNTSRCLGTGWWGLGRVWGLVLLQRLSPHQGCTVVADGAVCYRQYVSAVGGATRLYQCSHKRGIYSYARRRGGKIHTGLIDGVWRELKDVASWGGRLGAAERLRAAQVGGRERVQCGEREVEVDKTQKNKEKRTSCPSNWC